MELYIRIILNELRIIPCYRGYRYLAEAVKLTLDEGYRLIHITKDIYPELAKKNKVSIWMIETDIRNVIDHCWQNAPREKLEEYFPGRAGGPRPTNTEFIEGIIRYMTRHDEEGWGLDS